MRDKVLVADDSGVMRKIIVRALNTCGVTDVVEATDGLDAVDQFGKEDVNLVMTDWNMPKMNGIELTKTIRASGSNVPIIMVTTEADKRSVMNAIEAGVNDYLTKPFEQADLYAKIDKYLST